jgi:23S rRNA (uracil1939-C5)-methyltransferase
MKQYKEPQILKGVKIEKLVFGGQGLAHHEGATVFVWNVLPGEVVDARVIKKRKGVIEAVAETILTSSPHRQEPIDDHYLSSAPWQMMMPEVESQHKLHIAVETFKKLAGITVKDLEIVSDGQHEGYRNKMEFGFFLDEETKELSISLFNRGSRYPRPVRSVSIAQKELMDTAFQILEWLKKHKVSRWDLKSLIVRSNRRGETIAGLFVTNPEFTLSPAEGTVGANGFHIYYSTPKSPASVVTKYLTGHGDDFLVETLNGVNLKYGMHSFFQVNPNVFESTLNMINQYIPEGSDILDFYSGVGSIGIPLHPKVQSAVLVDSNEEAIMFAQQNINTLNEARDYTAKVSEAEKMIEEITSDKVLIVDPPRAGLHKNVVSRILEVTPESVIYLSCNISTQARDLKELKQSYTLLDVKLYDYFPRTPHFESLVILKKKKKFLGIL